MIVRNVTKKSRRKFGRKSASKFSLSLMLLLTAIAGAVTTMPERAAIARLGNPHRDPHREIVTMGVMQSAIALPDTGAQDDNWSCGPNSAARVLNHYGHQVDYTMVRAATAQKLFLPQRMRNPLTNEWVEMRTGTPPQTLQEVMQRWEGDRVKTLTHTSFERLVSLVESGKPAIALVRVGGVRVAYLGMIPYLHWITVTGIDRSRQLIYYTDTNSQTYTIGYQAFQEKWNLGLEKDVSVAIANVLKNNGVLPRTIVWVDRL